MKTSAQKTASQIPQRNRSGKARGKSGYTEVLLKKKNVVEYETTIANYKT